MTDYLHAEIDEAWKIAQRLIERGRAVETAIRLRDNTLYRLLSHLHRLDRQLRKTDWNTTANGLAAEYGGKALAKSKSAAFLLQLVHPTLHPKTRSKYASVLMFARKYKKDGSLRDFVSHHSGLNGSVKAAANMGKSQKKPTKAWGKPNSDPSPR